MLKGTNALASGSPQCSGRSRRKNSSHSIDSSEARGQHTPPGVVGTVTGGVLESSVPAAQHLRPLLY